MDGLVYRMKLHLRVFFGSVAVHANDNTLLALYFALVAVGGFLDLTLHETLLDGLYGPTYLINTLYVLPRLFLDGVRQRLDVVGAGQRVGGIGESGLVRQDLLGPQSYPRTLLGRERERLVEGVGVQALRPAQ